MARNPPLRTMIVEDEGLFRDLIKTALQQCAPEIEVVGAFADAETALAQCVSLRPDIALLDIELGRGLNGIELGLRLRSLLPRIGIVLLSNHRNPQVLTAVPSDVICGWSYLIKKDVADLDTLLRAIQGAADGLVVLSPALLRHPGLRTDHPLQRLTPRQRQILALIAQGYSNAAITEKLNLSPKTVANYINALYQELGIDPEDTTIHPRMRAALLYLEALRSH